MALSKEEVLDAISEMSVLDLSDLIKNMEEKFGVSAAAAVAVAAPSAGGGDAAAGEAEEKDEFDVVLTSFGDKKVAYTLALSLLNTIAEVKGAPDSLIGFTTEILTPFGSISAEKLKITVVGMITQMHSLKLKTSKPQRTSRACGQSLNTKC